MKKILFSALFILFCSDLCLASGKLYLRANSIDRDSPENSKGKYSLGLYIFQPLLPAKNLVFISFVGGSLEGHWLRSDQSFQYNCHSLVYTGGIDTIRYPNQAPQIQSVYYATIGYKLWE